MADLLLIDWLIFERETADRLKEGHSNRWLAVRRANQKSRLGDTKSDLGLIYYLAFFLFFPVALLRCCHAFVLKCTACGSFIAGVAPPSPRLLTQIHEKACLQLAAQWRLRLGTKLREITHLWFLLAGVVQKIETYAHPYTAIHLFVSYFSFIVVTLCQNPKPKVKTATNNE